MPYRLYIDEVGNDDLAHTDDDNHRYLSLTGIVMDIVHARDVLKPKFDELKADVFSHDPDDPLIFHRKEIVQRKKHFACLNRQDVRDMFDKRIMDIARECDYVVITTFLDKKAVLKNTHGRDRHPYHFLMNIMVEKYTQFLERRKAIGDLMPEARTAKQNNLLQDAFATVRNEGTYYISPSRIQTALPASHLKFRCKKDNVAGLQLCDLVAHPSHMHIRSLRGHAVKIGDFCNRIRQVLCQSKYDRSPTTGRILGYGIKMVP